MGLSKGFDRLSRKLGLASFFTGAAMHPQKSLQEAGLLALV